MKMFIRDAQTQRFYAGPDTWSSDGDLAMAFANLEAVLAHRADCVGDCQLMVQSEVTGSKILIPLNALTPPGPSSAPT